MKIKNGVFIFWIQDSSIFRRSNEELSPCREQLFSVADGKKGCGQWQLSLKAAPELTRLFAPTSLNELVSCPCWLQGAKRCNPTIWLGRTRNGFYKKRWSTEKENQLRRLSLVMETRRRERNGVGVEPERRLLKCSWGWNGYLSTVTLPCLSMLLICWVESLWRNG